MKTTVADLFSGVGGLSYGFAARTEFDLVFANEIDPVIASAYSANHPSVKMVNCDIAALTSEVLAEAAPHGVDLVVGGPPCQSYSTLGSRRMDARAMLFKEYRRVLSVLRPSMFVFENVTGLLSMDHGRLFPAVRREFEDEGYELLHRVVDAAQYGVPQHRERVLLVGVRNGIRFRFPDPDHGSESVPYVTVADAFADLPPLHCGEGASEYASEPCNDFLRFVRAGGGPLTEHHVPSCSAKLVRIMESLGDGQGKNCLPESIRPKSGFGNSYAKMWWGRPSPTVTRNFATPSSARCIHPRDSRPLTIREGARLQSFPDSYEFRGTDGKKRLEIGNAVPPLLSLAIAREAAAAFAMCREEGDVCDRYHK